MSDDFTKFFKSGDYLCRQGDPGDKMFVIRSGRVSIRKELSNGEQMELALLHAGDFLGEMSMIDPAPRSASAIALDAVRAVEIGMSNLNSVILNQPDLSHKIMKMFCSRIRETNILHEKSVSESQSAQLNAARLLLLLAGYDYKFENIISNKISMCMSYDELQNISGLKSTQIDAVFDDLRVENKITNFEHLNHLDDSIKKKLLGFMKKINVSINSVDSFNEEIWKNRIRNESNPHTRDKLYKKYRYLKEIDQKKSDI